MCAHRLWPTVAALGRGLISSRNEIIQQGVKAYNVQNFNSGYLGQGYQQQNSSVPGHDHHVPWPQLITHSTRGSFSKVVCQSFHSSNEPVVKEFQDLENEHAHAILRSLPAYSTTTVGGSDLAAPNANVLYYQYAMVDRDSLSTTSNWEKCSANEVANRFIEMSRLCRYQPMDLEDARLTSLCGELTKKLSYLSDQHLLMVLSSLALWPPTDSTTTPNFLAIWNALDQVCTQRMKKWDMSHMFLVADHWFALKLSKISLYNVKMTKILGYRVASMEPTQLVQYLFYANLSRKLLPYMIMKDLEKRLTEVLEHVSIEELGVVAMGFFKTQTFLKKEKLIDAIIVKTQENLEIVSDASLCAILKILRKSIPVTHSKSMHSLLDSLLPQLPRLNNMCLLQVALLGSNMLVFHEEVMNTIACRFSKDVKHLRLKDIERITFALMLYNYIPPSCPHIFMKIAEELRQKERINEINLYPKCFVSCVVYLVTVGLFAPDLISAALQPSMLNILGKIPHYANMGREVNELDWALEIEGPAGYPGYRLEPNHRLHLTKQYVPRIPSRSASNLTHQEKLILEVQDKLGAMLGGLQFITITNVLPHIQTLDLVFCTSSEGEPVEIPCEYLDVDPASLKRPLSLNRDIQWNAVIIGGRNSFIRNTNHLQGNVHMKRRQLNHLRYHVSVVPHMEYSRKSLRAKLGCLERILSEGSTLNSESRVESALISIKGQAIPQEEMYESKETALCVL